ncbi:MAG: class I SAM-dependent methyltransferase [Thermoleophilaceae bacterium]|nr:class I SAM-dependent methyltransferase [Thermoleophilaceae bacterium]
MSAVETSSGFEGALEAVAGVEGWLSDDQARRLWDAAGRVQAGGRIVEIGSFRGRSTIVLRRASLPTVEVVAIDPHAGSDRGPQEIDAEAGRGGRDFETFHANLARAGVDDKILHVREMSDAAHAAVEGPIDLLYVDGAHRYAPARNDIRDWGARVPEGGAMLVHDSYNAVGVTLAQLRLLVFSGQWRYVGRARSLAEYRRERLGPGARVTDALRQLGGMPWFVRNCLIKVAMVARLRPVARALGLPDEDDWPY